MLYYKPSCIDDEAEESSAYTTSTIDTENTGTRKTRNSSSFISNDCSTNGPTDSETTSQSVYRVNMAGKIMKRTRFSYVEEQLICL